MQHEPDVPQKGSHVRTPAVEASTLQQQVANALCANSNTSFEGNITSPDSGGCGALAQTVSPHATHAQFYCQLCPKLLQFDFVTPIFLAGTRQRKTRGHCLQDPTACAVMMVMMMRMLAT